MTMDDALPRLRYVETLPVEVDGHAMVTIRDPQRYATAMLTVDQGALFVLSMCDGRTTMRMLADEYRNRAGEELPVESIRQLLDVFEKHYFFESPRFRLHYEKTNRAWLDLTVRPAALFDYISKDNLKQAADELRGLLDGFFLEAGFEKGPDIVPKRNDAQVLIAPHIDYQRGGAIWAAAYGEFAQSFSGRTVIILGTNHQPHRSPVSMTRKKFSTPFGVLSVDEEILDDIAEKMPFDVFDDELPHRVEHSIELAAVMLAYLRPDISIVPILLGSARDLISGNDDPETDEALRALAEACRDVLESGNGDVAIIASADLAHVGPMFDDDFKIDPGKAKINKERDFDMMEALKRGEPEDFIGYVAEEKDVRKICGLSPIYVAATAGGRPFELLAHDQWVDPNGLGLVSYAALISRKEG